jgi:hypothetical protein
MMVRSLVCRELLSFECCLVFVWEQKVKVPADHYDVRVRTYCADVLKISATSLSSLFPSVNVLLTLFHTIHQWYMMMMAMMVLFSFCLQGHCWVHVFFCV